MRDIRSRPRDTRGIALPVTLLVVLAVGALATGAAVIGANHLLINRHYDRLSVLEAVAESGLEYARAQVNANKTLYPATGYSTLENNQQASSSSGAIHGVKRSIYVGPSGATSGQFGVFGSIVAVVTDDGGGKVVRRSEVTQESFAKYAYFTNIEPANIFFGGGDAIFGPVHSNDVLKLHFTGASFLSSVRTALTVSDPGFGTFAQGFTESVPRIEMPTTADLNDLRVQATSGNTAIVGDVAGASGRATTRLEFIAIDINTDGDSTDDGEGFMRVYQSSTAADYVSGLESIVLGGMVESKNCGWWAGGVFTSTQTAQDDSLWTAAAQNQELNDNAGRRCYLGGSDSLHAGFQATNSDDLAGGWVPFPGSVSPAVTAARTLEGDAAYLWPINRMFNPNFKGVIFVDGKVGISGTVRGRITIAATDDIIILDDLTYATDPGLGTCEDITGIFAGSDIRMADNPLNSSWQPAGFGYLTFDDTKDEFVHAVMLALDMFTAENYSIGSTDAEPCEGGSVGRGCLYLTGGVIQDTRGAVGQFTLAGTASTGYSKRYSYDPCAAQSPPPYFPTTGHFSRGQYYDVDPAGFNIGTYFGQITQGGP